MSKIDRINSEIHKQVSTIIDRELKHPALNGIISVTKVDTTNDLSISRVGISIMGATSDKEDIVKALNHSGGFIRRQLKTRINMRIIPELLFYIDNNIEYAVKMSKIIDDMNK